MSATAENQEGTMQWSLDVYPDGYDIYYGEENNYQPPKPKLVTLDNGNFAHIEAVYNGFILYEYPSDRLSSNRTLAEILVRLGLAPYSGAYHPFNSPPVKLADDISLFPDIVEMGPSRREGSYWPT